MKKEFSTILVLVLALIALYIFLDKGIFLYIALGMGVASLVFPPVAKYLHFFWMKLSLLMGSVSAVMILAFIFFVIVLPLSIIAKLTGKKFLVLKRKGDSYFTPRNFLYDKESLENVW